MTEQLPRPIDPKDIRVGDRVRQAIGRDGDVVAYEFTVVDRCVNSLRSERRTYTTDRVFDWALLDRPEPPREVGSRWRDPETGAEYAKTDHRQVEYVMYRGTSGTGGDWRLIPNESHGDAQIIRRLVPLDGE